MIFYVTQISKARKLVPLQKYQLPGRIYAKLSRKTFKTTLRTKKGLQIASYMISCTIKFRSESLFCQIWVWPASRSEEHTSELQSRENLVCRLLLEKKKK